MVARNGTDVPVDIAGQVVICMRQECWVRLQDPAHLSNALLKDVAGIIKTLQRASVGCLDEIANVVEPLGAAHSLLVEGQDIIDQDGDFAERRYRWKVEFAVLLFREDVVGEYHMGIYIWEAGPIAEITREAGGTSRGIFTGFLLHLGAREEFDRRLEEHRRAIWTEVRLGVLEETSRPCKDIWPSRKGNLPRQRLQGGRLLWLSTHQSRAKIGARGAHAGIFLVIDDHQEAYDHGAELAGKGGAGIPRSNRYGLLGVLDGAGLQAV